MYYKYKYSSTGWFRSQKGWVFSSMKNTDQTEEQNCSVHAQWLLEAAATCRDLSATSCVATQ
jgi:hypothetical protein